ncbi:DUF1285 domain-containing protein [Marinobacter sp. SS21]|uniref:DUF1285 domain-containing protein n=1 Tax=Marinobacter sp. SS21 TaxID=2979460 RepID=UPI00232F43B1|nr:DUF1285 domain-containing protein [Marinobacter sp. SS21]MDC0661805.1 DUF1285 domain-containing protein [Marinobacter sp. SS21]
MKGDPKTIEEQLSTAPSGEKGLPPIHQWHPPLSGDIDIRVARNGLWIYQGDPMEREAIPRLFSTILRREQDGDHYLVTPVEKWRIVVDDTPLLAHTVEVTGDGQDQQVFVITNMDERVAIDGDHPLTVDHYPDSNEPRPVITIRHGLEARLVTAAYYDLANYVVEMEQGSGIALGIWSHGQFFPMA